MSVTAATPQAARSNGQPEPIETHSSNSQRHLRNELLNPISRYSLPSVRLELIEYDPIKQNKDGRNSVRWFECCKKSSAVSSFTWTPSDNAALPPPPPAGWDNAHANWIQFDLGKRFQSTPHFFREKTKLTAINREKEKEEEKRFNFIGSWLLSESVIWKEKSTTNKKEKKRSRFVFFFPRWRHFSECTPSSGIQPLRLCPPRFHPLPPVLLRGDVNSAKEEEEEEEEEKNQSAETFEWNYSLHPSSSDPSMQSALKSQTQPSGTHSPLRLLQANWSSVQFRISATNNINPVNIFFLFLFIHFFNQKSVRGNDKKLAQGN